MTALTIALLLAFAGNVARDYNSAASPSLTRC